MYRFSSMSNPRLFYRTLILKQVSIACRCSSSITEDYQFLQKSKVPTYHFQKSLPRLPIPKLEDSCRRYLDAQRPLLHDEEFSKTESLVNDFKSGVGRDLHERLVNQDKSNKHTSYISGAWFDMYLCDRRSLLNHNPIMGMTDDPNPSNMSQMVRATNLVVSSLRMMRSLRSATLEPEVFHLNPKKSDTPGFRRFVRMLPESVSFYGAYLYKAFPLDMSQYNRLFNSTRIPRPERDELWSDPDAKHVALMRNGNVVAVDVLHPNGDIKSPAEIKGLLKAAAALCDTQDPLSPGVFTAQHRDKWTEARVKMVEAGNEEALKVMDSALFALSLDDIATKQIVPQVRQFLHGPCGNRWFDKCFTLVVDAAGSAAVTFEHAWGDGVAVLRYFNEVFADSTRSPPHVTGDTSPIPPEPGSVRRVEFKLTPEIEAMRDEAKDYFTTVTNNVNFDYVQYQGGGKNVFKKHKVSPDAMMQLAFQVGHYKMAGQAAATYESCSTAAFKHGRTETIRSCTSETLAVSRALCGGKASSEDLRQLLQSCSDKHNELTKNAAMGQGFDRHLFSLRKLSEALGESVPLFTDPNYQSLNHIILSTSTLTAPSVTTGGFVPVVPDGFGIGYGCYDDWMGCMVSTWENRNPGDLIVAIKESFDDILGVLNKSEKS